MAKTKYLYILRSTVWNSLTSLCHISLGDLIYAAAYNIPVGEKPAEVQYSSGGFSQTHPSRWGIKLSGED